MRKWWCAFMLAHVADDKKRDKIINYIDRLAMDQTLAVKTITVKQSRRATGGQHAAFTQWLR